MFKVHLYLLCGLVIKLFPSLSLARSIYNQTTHLKTLKTLSKIENLNTDTTAETTTTSKYLIQQHIPNVN